MQHFLKTSILFIHLKLKTMQEILNEIVPIIAEKLGVDPSEVTMEASFTNDLGAC